MNEIGPPPPGGLPLEASDLDLRPQYRVPFIAATALVAQMASAIKRRATMGDRSPKSKQRDQKQKDAVKAQGTAQARSNEVRSLEWRDYVAEDGMIRLRPEFSKNKHDRKLPIDRGELAAIVMRRLEARRQHPECPYILHRDGRRIGDFRKTWKRACDVIGLSGRIVHDLRRSGIKHLIGAGNDPHTVMQFSGHRTWSTLDRYHIIDLDDLRVAAERASDFRGTLRRVATLHGEQPQFSLRSQESSASTGRRS